MDPELPEDVAIVTGEEKGHYFWRIVEHPQLGTTRALFDPQGNWLCWTDPTIPVLPAPATQER